MTVGSNYAITFGKLIDWLTNIAPGFLPMRSKTKTSRTQYADLDSCIEKQRRHQQQTNKQSKRCLAPKRYIERTFLETYFWYTKGTHDYSY